MGVLYDLNDLLIFLTIAASRPLNKHVNTGAVIRAKPGTDRAGRS